MKQMRDPDANCVVLGRFEIIEYALSYPHAMDLTMAPGGRV